MRIGVLGYAWWPLTTKFGKENMLRMNVPSTFISIIEVHEFLNLFLGVWCIVVLLEFVPLQPSRLRYQRSALLFCGLGNFRPIDGTGEWEGSNDRAAQLRNDEHCLGSHIQIGRIPIKVRTIIILNYNQPSFYILIFFSFQIL